MPAATPERRREIASNAARIKNIRQGEESLRKYLENPNRCRECNKPILPQLSGRETKSCAALNEIKAKKFCNSSCSVIHHNRIRLQNPGVHILRNDKPEKKQVWTISCSGCGTTVVSTTRKKRCEECAAEAFLGNKTKAQVRRQSIQAHAQKSIRGPRACRVCGYSTFVEVCHVKSVSSFTNDDTVQEINHPANLVYLCPNHHKELDRAILVVDGLRGHEE